ncbi:hypothetical protein [Leeuwenhoekiella marinoflava]|uniref:hypothetical protein n=1 Tax=Leeuwenhoekiella marinoflava TaxID=988 RepID=UPI00300219C9
MARIKHHNFLDTVAQVIPAAKAPGIAHLRAEDPKFTGRYLKVNGGVSQHYRKTGYLEEFQSYRQLLYQIILRACKLGMNRIDFGISTNFEKRKLAAAVIPKQAFVHTDDNFLLEYLEMMRTRN